jgi:hypothetical protein
MSRTESLEPRIKPYDYIPIIGFWLHLTRNLNNYRQLEGSRLEYVNDKIIHGEMGLSAIERMENTDMINEKMIKYHMWMPPILGLVNLEVATYFLITASGSTY